MKTYTVTGTMTRTVTEDFEVEVSVSSLSSLSEIDAAALEALREDDDEWGSLISASVTRLELVEEYIAAAPAAPAWAPAPAYAPVRPAAPQVNFPTAAVETRNGYTAVRVTHVPG